MPSAPTTSEGGHPVSSHSAVDVIRTKRDGGRLSDDQIRWFMTAYTAGEVADEQAAALAMAIFWRGMDPDELAVWTEAMIDSGERLDLSAVTRPTVDKHSTGGVGDKVSLPLIPLAAACGLAVPQLSGRGLGHTGGTLDKMEAIPGWRAQLGNEEFIAVLAAEGGVICAAGPRPRPGRPPPLRAAGHDRHGRVHPADRLVDHVQEDRRGHRRAGPRREVRLRRVPPRPRARPGAGPRRWSGWARPTACGPPRC